jgi:hypothetical protein
MEEVQKKSFPIADVLSWVTGRLLADDIKGPWAVMEWVAGDRPISEEEMKKIGGELRQFIVDCFPVLKTIAFQAQTTNLILGLNGCKGITDQDVFIADWLRTVSGQFDVGFFSIHQKPADYGQRVTEKILSEFRK